MRFWTVHLRPGSEPVLVREGFSWAALIFGPVWLLLARAWIAAALTIAAGVMIGWLTNDFAGSILSLALALCLGFYGHDLQRWSLERRGFRLTHVLAARNEDAAWARLYEARPELGDDLAGDLPVGAPA